MSARATVADLLRRAAERGSVAPSLAIQAAQLLELDESLERLGNTLRRKGAAAAEAAPARPAPAPSRSAAAAPSAPPPDVPAEYTPGHPGAHWKDRD